MRSILSLLASVSRGAVDAVRALPAIGGTEPQPGVRPRATRESAPVDYDHDDTPEKYRASGAWTLFGTWLILLAVAIFTGGFGKMWSALAACASFDLVAVRQLGDSVTSLVSIVAASIVIQLPVIMVVGRLLDKCYGPSKSHGVAAMFKGFKHHYMNLTLIVLLEELIARGLFLGVPYLIWPNLPTWVFFTLFLVGNAIWALVHLGNFKDKAERQFMRVLPQFLSGIPFTILFINYGLLGSIMVHLTFNFLLLSIMRKGIFNKGEWLIIAYRASIALISWLLLGFFGKSLRSLGQWFDPDVHSFAIPGWQFHHYLLATIFIGSALAVVAELLLFDLHPTQIEAAGLDGVGRAVVLMTAAFASFFGLGLINLSFDVRVLIMALVFLLVRKSASGSGMSRVFFINLPVLMFELFAVLALGWQSAAWLIVVALAFVELPERWFRHLDARWEGRSLVDSTAISVELGQLVRQK